MGSQAVSVPLAGDVPDIQPAIALHRRGCLNEAEQVYTAILAIDPAHFDALHLLGLLRLQQGCSLEALRLMQAALSANPDSADALSNYGLALDALKRHEDALASFDKAIALERHHTNALNNRGLTLASLGRLEAAVASWDRALAADPCHVEAMHNRGNALHNLKRHEEALADYDRMLSVRPDNLDVLNNRGGSLVALGRLTEALDSYDRAIAIRPHQPELFINRAHVLADLGEFDSALAVYAQAAAMDGRRAEAEWCASLVRLRLGQFAQGWKDYEWRWQQASWVSQRRDFTQPLWLGQQPLAGRTVLLHAEQGLGDTVQFVRYARLVAGLGAKVLLEVQPELKPLLSNTEGVARTFARGEPLPAFDLHCPLMSLPLAFGTTLETVPAAVPYLQAPADRVAKWRERLGERRSPRVGIVWGGSPTHKNDHNRSIAFERFAPLLSAPGVSFVGLQKNASPADALALRRHRNAIDVGNELHDFADLAAVISLLDVIVAADTSVVHFAGALGKPVWVLLPHSPDFRWLLGRDDSPWYPTARLFRQPQPGDWESVLARVLQELEQLPSGVATSNKHEPPLD